MKSIDERVNEVLGLGRKPSMQASAKALEGTAPDEEGRVP